jgi:mycoredoxin
MNSDILLYATTWCYDCRRARQILDRSNVNYQFINIDENSEARDYVIQVNHGYRSVPTIVFPDGSIMVEPRDHELRERLSQLQTIE